MVILQGVKYASTKYIVLRKEFIRDTGMAYTLYLDNCGDWHNSYYPNGMFKSIDSTYQAIEKAIEKGNWSVEVLHWEEVIESDGYADFYPSGTTSV